MKARNLETGVVSNVGPDFLKHQGKPFIGASGKIYQDGVWVEETGKKLSKEAQKLIDDAKTAPLVSKTPPMKEPPAKVAVKKVAAKKVPAKASGTKKIVKRR